MEPLEAKLTAILGMVNDWLKFAEAKNLALAGFTGTGAAVALAAYAELDDPAVWQSVGFLLAVGVLLSGLVCALLSFLPQTNLTAWLAEPRGRPAPDDNLYFYGHLVKYAPRHLAEAVARRYLDRHAEDEPSASDVDLAAQIVANARITVWKLRLFSWSVCGLIGGTLLFSACAALTVLT
jgi:hypothetical protein